MEIQYYKSYSPCLGKEMECKVYGHAGRPVLFIPCQDGRFYDFENYKMAEVFAPWIESGQVMVFSIDTIDQETWSNKNGDPGWRIGATSSGCTISWMKSAPLPKRWSTSATAGPGIRA